MLKLFRKKPKYKDSEKGMALIESIPVLFMLVIIFNFSLGFFGAIHSGILNSIGSYNYAMETFRYRSNLMYFRPGISTKNYNGAFNRVHGTLKDGTEQSSNEEKGRWPATVRSIKFDYVKGNAKKGLGQANEIDSGREYGNKGQGGNIWTADSNYAPDSGSEAIQTPRIWVKTVYGICVTADCGDSN